jgi:hypothetical protein
MKISVKQILHGTELSLIVNFEVLRLVFFFRGWLFFLFLT